MSSLEKRYSHWEISEATERVMGVFFVSKLHAANRTHYMTNSL